MRSTTTTTNSTPMILQKTRHWLTFLFCIVQLSLLSMSLGSGAAFWTSNASAGTTPPSDQVVDLYFEDLSAAVQEHPLLAVAFYSPGCGRCRRLLPSWSQAAQLLKDQNLPIRLARIDISSRGGMVAWKALGLKRVPAVKVFVGKNSDEPLPYTGHLDAGGIAAHLAMLERDRRRLLEHQDKYGNSAKTRRQANGRDGGDSNGAHEISSTELLESGVTLVSLSASPFAADVDLSKGPSTVIAPLVENLRGAVGRQRLSLLLFIPEETLKARRMIAEIRKAAPFLGKVCPPTAVILVDTRSPGSSSCGSDHGNGSWRRSAGRCDPLSSNADKAFLKRLSAEIQVPLENVPELRIFLDGKAWVGAGVFRGLPTKDGIVEHMEWVAVEAGLRPKRMTTGMQGKGASASAGETATAAIAVNSSSLNVPIDSCIAVSG